MVNAAVVNYSLAEVHARSPRFQARLAAALRVVRDALADKQRPYIAYTSGKDSTVVAGLVHALRPDVPLLWSDDELEYPEVVEHMMALKRLAGDQLIVTEGHALHAHWFFPWVDRPFWRAPLPGTRRIAMPVDDYMRGQGYDLTFLGTRAEESQRRRAWLLAAGPTYRVRSGTGTRCCPIWDWTADDVWTLIETWGLAVAPVYARLDEIGVHRIRQRVGPLPLTPRAILADGWPELLARLEARYGPRWR